MSGEMSRKTFFVSVGAGLAVLRLLLACRVLLWFGLAAPLTIPTVAMSTFSGPNATEWQLHRTMRFTAEELLNTRFASRISDDIDLDPCKGGKLSGVFRIPKVEDLICCYSLYAPK